MVTGDLVPTFCPLCVSRCGARAEVTDGKLRALLPDPSHPTGRGDLPQGQGGARHRGPPRAAAAPAQADHAQGGCGPRLGTDHVGRGPGHRRRAAGCGRGCRWARVGCFSSSSPSTSAISDAIDWVQRLVRAFGSPNFSNYMELCGWGRFLAPLYTFGASVPGSYLPDLENAGCILFWGYNPSVARLAHATSTVAALARGAKLVVVDPRKAGLAAKADHWLRVRPGTDAALALSLTHVMLENGWYDADFVRDWTNAADLVDGTTVWSSSPRGVRSSPRRWPKGSPACPPTTSSRRRGRCGSHGPSRSTRGAESSSTAARPRPSARSTSCTR